MKTWKKNVVAAAVLVTVCAGIYLNWLYTEGGQPVSLTDKLDSEKIMDDSMLVMGDNAQSLAAQEGTDLSNTTSSDYFASVRLSRQEARDSAVSMLQEAMSYDESASEASAEELEQIVQVALSEAQIESLVVAKGYADCVSMLQEAMSYDESASEASAEELEQIVQVALSEAQIESLVVAKGYADCVAYMSDDGISVAVAAPEEGLQQTDVAVITDIILAQSSYDLENIRIVEVQ